MSRLVLRQRYPGYPGMDERPTTLRQARRELSELLEAAPDLVREQLEVLGVEGPPGVAGWCETLTRAAEVAVRLIPTAEYSFEGYGPRIVDHGKGRFATTDTGRELTVAGEHLAGCLALMFAWCLLERDPSLRWDVATRPRTDISYLLPVIVGEFPLARCDPFEIAGTWATRLARRGQASPDDLTAAVDSCIDLVQGSPRQEALRRELVALQRAQKARRGEDPPSA